MSGHLCLKWNNHSSAFIKNIGIIQAKEKYCDATIACQGKYFPVHRMILSTCSDYFDEMFERIKCPHPYIVFKDIEPGEMELLLNYMYQGEVNVVQERLPTLIKAAEALKIKGLAVPDDLPSKESSKKRSSSDDHSQPKSRRRRRHSSQSEQLADNVTESAEENYQMEASHSDNLGAIGQLVDISEPKLIKEEPIDTYGDGGLSSGASNSITPVQPEHETVGKEENVFVDFPITEESSSYIKSENDSQDQPYDDQSSSWADYTSGSVLPQPEMSAQDDMNVINQEYQDPTEEPRTYPSTSSDAYLRSLNMHISKGIPKCPHCPYKSLYNLARHIKSKHTKIKPYLCQYCSLRFTSNCDRVAHVRIHTGEKPFECQSCHQKFRLAQSLKKHLARMADCRRNQ